MSISGSSQILLKNFDTQVIHEPTSVKVERRPYGLLIVGFSFILLGIGCINLSYSGLAAVDQTFSPVFSGLGSLMLCLGGILIFFSFPILLIRKARAFIYFDKILRTVRIRKQNFSFDEISGFELRNFGRTYLMLMMLMKNGQSVALITLRNQYVKNLNSLKEVLENDLALRISNEVTRSIEPESFDKQFSYFYMAFGVLWIAASLLFFSGLEFTSAYDSKSHAPFWILGVAMIGYGLFKFFQAKRKSR